ncbi:alpha/beta hydrolase [Pseudomonas thivervalensis]|uniref:Alpha/beta hydrolase n=1 Tax=Pseudomonas thivervalensis TaxID=86265 RepID=A0A176NE85_9PSED|nr:alpha/beta fold hydrolase [Pseudomonas thivervalensis]AXA54308.1 alpha/beta hydrolase [Pseudomonas thivervalensis]AXA59988.1 alpha/beta hydrolase [Pseudomonas thivervalensis]OAB49434.1 lysophospholipase [Pseudomonas thivervalensis]SDF73325.1 Esterase/lipase [Pseudomonas thivervalensis]
MLGVAATVACLALMAGCARQPSATDARTEPATFQDYTQASRAWIEARRVFQTANRSDELAWNAPYEVRPDAPSSKAILLLHGLGDSPWSFVDIAQDLAAQGFVVRVALLPGHGTQPADLIDVQLEQWQQLVEEQVALLHKEFPDVYLGGFSTGANLALAYSVKDPSIRGLLLFSPAFRSSESYDWATPWLAHFKTWILAPDNFQPQQSAVRYHNVPTNGFAQFYRSSVAVRRLIEHEDFDRPVVIVLTEQDSVVDVRYVRELFKHRFTHAASRLIWYGQAEPAGSSGAASDPRILARTDRIVDERISQFSHMGILFSPTNPLYGRSGSLRFCRNSRNADEVARCEAGEEVWYSDWGYSEPGKIHARLTYNPYFRWQSNVLREVLAAAE